MLVNVCMLVNFYFHFVKSYNSQTKRNGTFRNVVLGICLLRKGDSILYQIYRFAVGRSVNKWGYEWGYVSFILDHLIRGF